MAMTLEHGNAEPLPEITRWQAVLHALLITLFGCVLFGLGCFVLLANYLSQRMDRYHAAIWLQLGFTAAMALTVGFIVDWQRRKGSSLAELGWQKPTTPLALVLAVVLGALYIGFARFGARQLLPDVDVTEITWVRLALMPLGLFMAVAEETLMRGLFMTELQRGRVPAWIQILASGACSALYHAFQNPTLIGYLPSFFLFSIHAGLYVLGKRSLTPVFIAHGIYNVLGEPYLLMLMLAAIKR
jgi:membrane protease YdiL (CAAX protease family)